MPRRRRTYSFRQARLDMGLDYALDQASSYCAPTALADLMGCTRREAAELLHAEGLFVENTAGGVCSRGWDRFIESLGGVKVSGAWDAEVQKYKLEEARGAFWLAEAEYARGYRRRRPAWRPAHALYRTVTQFLADHPEGTYVLNTDGHTLLARDGVVVADTQTRTKSARRRVYYAYRMP